MLYFTSIHVLNLLFDKFTLFFLTNTFSGVTIYEREGTEIVRVCIIMWDGNNEAAVCQRY